MPDLDRVVIIGGGVGGLTAALGLQRAGIEVEVHEKYDHLARRASAFTLWSYAVQRLIELRIDMDRVGAPLEVTEIRDRKGKLIEALPVGDVSRKLGAPSYEVDRRELRAAFLDALGDNVVRMPSECVAVEFSESSTVAKFKDGSTATGDVVIGADGAHSVTRSAVAASATPEYAGYSAWAGVLENFEHPLLKPNRHLEIWGHGSIGGVADLGAGRVRWYVGRGRPAGVGWGRVDHAELVDHTADWYALVSDAVAAADPDSITAMEAWELAPLESWVKGRLVLLGDSAHLTTPSISGGACATIDDSARLVAHLTGSEPLDAALGAFETERKSRDEHMVKRSRGVGQLQHLHSPIACWLRDHAFEHMPAKQARRVLEEIAGGG